MSTTTSITPIAPITHAIAGTSDRLFVDDAIDVSVVIPMLDEQDNIVAVYNELSNVASGQSLRYELIFIDDGSRDDTVHRLKCACESNPYVTIIEFAKRFGQTAALASGFARARGWAVVPMDADMQNDPHDIPNLVARLDEAPGWDIVSGWRRHRHDRLLSRKLPSIVANRLIRRLTWTTEIHDFGCSLKAYRREVLDDVHLYGEMHRFLPAICKWRGARVTEAVVHHRPRSAGESKYGMRRTVKVILDLLTVKFLGDYLTKPIYFFGKAACFAMVAALLSLGLAVAQKYGILTEYHQSVNLNNNIFVLFAMMTFLMSIMFLMMGVLSELLVRIYHESQGRTPYRIRKVTRCGVDGEKSAYANGDREHAMKPSANGTC